MNTPVKEFFKPAEKILSQRSVFLHLLGSVYVTWLVLV
ncbi:hypothetical protein O1Q83_01763 [Lonepinella koalarum]